MVSELKCDVCDSTSFEVAVDLRINLDTEADFGNVRYSYIGEIRCKGCMKTLPYGDLKTAVANKAKQIIDSMQEETLVVK